MKSKHCWHDRYILGFRSPSPGSDVAPPTTRRRSRSPSSSKKDPGPSKDAPKPAETQVVDPKAEFAKLLGNGTRSGGVYMPPARLRALQEAAASKDKASPEYQRLSWDALRKSITGIVNRVNIANIKQIIPELFGENLIRGRGLFARSVMKAQAASLPFTPVFACVVAVVNTKLPQVGELLLIRLISQFRRAFKRNDKVRNIYVLRHLSTESLLDCMPFCHHIPRSPREPNCCT